MIELPHQPRAYNPSPRVNTPMNDLPQRPPLGPDSLNDSSGIQTMDEYEGPSTPPSKHNISTDSSFQYDTPPHRAPIEYLRDLQNRLPPPPPPSPVLTRKTKIRRQAPARQSIPTSASTTIPYIWSMSPMFTYFPPSQSINGVASSTSALMPVNTVNPKSGFHSTAKTETTSVKKRLEQLKEDVDAAKNSGMTLENYLATKIRSEPHPLRIVDHTAPSRPPKGKEQSKLNVLRVQAAAAKRRNMSLDVYLKRHEERKAKRKQEKEEKKASTLRI